MATYTEKKAATQQRIAQLEAKHQTIEATHRPRIRAKLADARATLARIEAKIAGEKPAKTTKTQKTARQGRTRAKK